MSRPPRPWRGGSFAKAVRTSPRAFGYGLRLCLCRPPRPEQIEPLVALYATEYERYNKNPAAAAALATDPLGPLPSGMEPADLAAWTTVANVLLNLDSVLTKG